MLTLPGAVCRAQSYYSQSFADFDQSNLPDGMSIADSGEDADRGAELSLAADAGFDGKGAALLTTSDGDYDPTYSPALVLELPEEVTGYVTLGMDINIKAAEGRAFAVNIANANDFYFDYTNFAFYGDESCGASDEGASFKMNNWYRLALTFGFEQKQYKADMTDLATGEKISVVATRTLPTSRYATGIKTVELSLLSKASVAIANIEIADADEPEQIVPKVTQTAYVLLDGSEVKKADWTDGNVDFGAAAYRIYFSTELDESTLSGIVLEKAGEELGCEVKYNAEGQFADVMLPALVASAEYDVCITAALMSASGAPAKPQTLTFKVAPRALTIEEPADADSFGDGAISAKRKLTATGISTRWRRRALSAMSILPKENGTE